MRKATNRKSWKTGIWSLYFVAGAGLIKIGFSNNPLMRFATMKTDSPVPLELIGSIPIGTEDETKQEESRRHTQYAPYRRHGEWFNLSPSEVEMIRLEVRESEKWRERRAG